MMTLDEILSALQDMGDEKTRKSNIRQGINGPQFGVKLGELRKLAKKIKTNHSLGLRLWESDFFDARMLAVLLIEPASLHATELDALVRSIPYERLADWVNAYIVAVHPDREMLRQKWMHDTHPMAARAGWNLTAQSVLRHAERLDIPALLDRIEAEMAEAPPAVQWTMNFTLAEIGINHAAYRNRAVEIGEKLGVYRNYPTSKGCTSPYAPVWIAEMLSRQKQDA